MKQLSLNDVLVYNHLRLHDERRIKFIILLCYVQMAEELHIQLPIKAKAFPDFTDFKLIWDFQLHWNVEYYELLSVLSDSVQSQCPVQPPFTQENCAQFVAWYKGVEKKTFFDTLFTQNQEPPSQAIQLNASRKSIASMSFDTAFKQASIFPALNIFAGLWSERFDNNPIIEPLRKKHYTSLSMIETCIPILTRLS